MVSGYSTSKHSMAWACDGAIKEASSSVAVSIQVFVAEPRKGRRRGADCARVVKGELRMGCAFDAGDAVYFASQVLVSWLQTWVSVLQQRFSPQKVCSGSQNLAQASAARQYSSSWQQPWPHGLPIKQLTWPQAFSGSAVSSAQYWVGGQQPAPQVP